MAEKDDLKALAAAYAEHFASPHVWTDDKVFVERGNSATKWAADRVLEMQLDEPELLLDLVLEVLRLNPSHDVIPVLAAGPMEDYLAKLGEREIGKVEVLARSNPQFASLLGGVWKNRMTDEVWDRVRAVWDRRGWDGNPE